MLEDSSDDEMEEEEEEEELVVALAIVARLSKNSRNFKWQDTRLNWSKHLEKLQHAGEFDSTHRMSFETFTKLKNILGDRIQLDAAKSNNSCPDASGYIYPELIMHIGLRTLAGGKFPDIRDAAGVSRASVCHCRDLFLDAVLDAHELAIMLPTLEELPELAARFRSKSTFEAMKGCVGCIDGLLARIVQPSVENPRVHFSGHCHCCGLNVQAMCDERLRFRFFAVAGVGNAADSAAFDGLSIKDWVLSLPAGYFIVGDAAHLLDDRLLVPCTGRSRGDDANDVFNCCLSQLRIRIEMAFGGLSTKWRILRQPIECNLENTSKILEACARLHNFEITEDQADDFIPPVNGQHKHTMEENFDIDALEDFEVGGNGFIPIRPEDDHPEWDATQEVQLRGHSFTRESIRHHILQHGHQRPTHDVARNGDRVD